MNFQNFNNHTYTNYNPMNNMNNNMMMNNQMNPNGFNYFNMMGMNNNMNMNMFNLMMFYLQQTQNFQNTMNNGINNQFNYNNTNRIIPINTNMSKSQVLPRVKKTEFCDPYPGSTGEKINLFFETPSGHKINMLVPIDAKMKDILVQYVTRVNLGPNVIDKSIYFLYGGKKIKKNEEKTVWQMNILSGSIIIVIDKQGVMGA